MSMTASSKPSLRSSSRRNSALSHSPATVVHHHNTSTPATHLRKRAHGFLSSNNCHQVQVVKRQKLTSKALSPPKSFPGNHVAKTLVAASPNPSTVTHPTVNSHPNSRITSAVQPQTNGTLVTNGEAHPHLVSNSTQTSKEKAPLKETDKRTLRSQDGGSRSKSELSLYFPNYEELIGNEPKETGMSATLIPSCYLLNILLEFLTPETKILITDDYPKLTPSHPLHSPPILHTATSSLSQTLHATTPSSPTTFQILDFTHLISAPLLHVIDSLVDPLPSTLYFKAHRRAERQEKQLRNIEKERAQHEKVQLERLLDGLNSHDWLRVMGISGITDGEKRAFEPKREYFIREVGGLIAKFRRWKEEEKRRKVERDAEAIAEDDEERDEEGDEDIDGASSTASTNPAAASNTDLLAARQLHREALLSSSSVHSQPLHPRSRHELRVPVSPTLLPFTSFYTKPYLRAAAINKHRRGRTRFAFGQAVPEMSEKDFELPGTLLTEEMIEKSRRRGRRMRRGRGEDG